MTILEIQQARQELQQMELSPLMREVLAQILVQAEYHERKRLAAGRRER